VSAHPQLDLVALIVSDPSKVGRDAGELAGMTTLGVSATDDSSTVLGTVDAVVYAATADTRPAEALADLVECLASGANVVSTSFYSLAHPPSVPPSLATKVMAACTSGGSSVFVSGIDPGWVTDVLPAVLHGVSAGATELRCQELFNYATYDQPEVVRSVIGFGQPMDDLPLMLHDFALTMVWEPAVRNLADLLGLTINEVTTLVERRPLERDVQVPGMGLFEAGTQGAFRFEVRAHTADGQPALVIEHVTRIDDTCATDWPVPASPGGEHRVCVTGHPELVVTVHGHQPGEPDGAGGGNAVAANRLVNSLPAVCSAPSGILGPCDLPPYLDRRTAMQAN
jgi:2,4-diaminopentanoate dehydrogenase